MQTLRSVPRRRRIESEFDLSDRERLLKGGEFRPGHHHRQGYATACSYKLITHAREPHMPHKRAKLPAEAIAASRLDRPRRTVRCAAGVAARPRGQVWTRNRGARRGPDVLVVSAAATGRAARGEGCRLVQDADRSLHPGEAGSRQLDAQPAGRADGS